MTTIRSIFASSLALAGGFGIAMLGPVSAEAALVQQCGVNICYVWDDNPAVNPGISLFGNPVISPGTDSLTFSPAAFVAAGADGGFQSLKAVFQFSRVYTQNGAEIVDITISESGVYSIVGGGIVGSSLRLQSIDRVNDGGGLFPQVAVTSPIPNFNTSIPTGPTEASWELTASISPAAVFQDLASVVDLQIQNLLDAFTFGPGQSAFIRKEFVVTTTSVVPVPAAAWLLGTGLVGFGALVRRRAQQARC